MNLFYALLISFLAGISTFLGGLFIYVNVNDHTKYLSFMLSLTTSIMISLSIFDLIPESFKILYPMYKNKYIFIIMFSIIICYILIKLINKLVNNNNNKDKLYKVGIMSMIILMLHNIPEGIITFLSSYQNINLGIKLAIGIAMHNIPEGIAIAVPIYYSTKSKKKALSKTLISGLSEPLGGLITYLLIGKYISNILIAFILTIVACLMTTLSIEEIFPEARREGKSKEIILALTLGVIIVLINVIIL